MKKVGASKVGRLDWSSLHRIAENDFQKIAEQHATDASSRATLRTFLDNLVDYAAGIAAAMKTRSPRRERWAIVVQIGNIDGLIKWWRRQQFDPTGNVGWRYPAVPGFNEMAVAAERILDGVVTPSFVEQVIATSPERPGPVNDSSLPLDPQMWASVMISRYPGEIIGALLSNVRDVLLATQRDLQTGRKGGQPRNVVGRFIVAFSELGKKPTSSMTGEFHRFVEEVATAAGLSTEWIDSQLRGGVAEWSRREQFFAEMRNSALKSRRSGKAN